MRIVHRPNNSRTRNPVHQHVFFSSKLSTIAQEIIKWTGLKIHVSCEQILGENEANTTMMIFFNIYKCIDVVDTKLGKLVCFMKCSLRISIDN